MAGEKDSRVSFLSVAQLFEAKYGYTVPLLTVSVCVSNASLRRFYMANRELLDEEEGFTASESGSSEGSVGSDRGSPGPDAHQILEWLARESRSRSSRNARSHQAGEPDGPHPAREE